ncbi:MAG: hypothetical protein E6R08_09130 [Nevskiaceae bacterium]|nr:MAG: hypothetical protein E6R08_09130 [Nevskiaceae bacterium]
MTYHWLSDTFKHRRREATHEVAFWKDNHASDEAEATHASVFVKTEHSHRELSFRWPEEKASVDSLEEMLRRAFEIGRQDAKREVRHALGIHT